MDPRPVIPTPARAARRRRALRAVRRMGLPALVALLMLVLASPASAADRFDLAEWNCSSRATTYGSGQLDARGYLYVVCDQELRMYDRSGRLAYRQRLTLGDDRILSIYDVAPAPDGSAIYVTRPMFETPEAQDEVVRFKRTPTAYVYDPAWKLGGQPCDGCEYTGRHIATDWHGNLYLSNGLWASGDVRTLHGIYKFRPDGSRITRFGFYANGDRNGEETWRLGFFFTSPTGVGVSRDGRYVYTAELANNRIQRWVRQANGTYEVDLAWGGSLATDGDRTGGCVADEGGGALELGADERMFRDGPLDARFGKYLGAPYDVVVDPWGDVYVANTTCSQVSRFSATGVHEQTVQVGAPRVHRIHGLAVDARGQAYLGDANRRLVRTAGAVPAFPVGVGGGDPEPEDPPQGERDRTRPVVTRFGAPAATATRTISLRPTATDDTALRSIRLIVRIRDRAGKFHVRTSGWQPAGSHVEATLYHAPGYPQAIIAQARDASGNRSAPVARVIRWYDDHYRPAAYRTWSRATSTARWAVVYPYAIDDNAVTHIRMSWSEDGIERARWVPYTRRWRFVRAPQAGRSTLYIQVRDVVRRESDVASHVVTTR